jgi:3-oxoacyl-[acyl-carrier protein] reductase
VRRPAAVGKMRSMDLGISGRVAVVTGGTRGIGAAVCAALEAEGVRVVPASRATGIDVLDPAAPERVLEAVGGTVDILVNNAGTAAVKALADHADEDWRSMFELHVVAGARLMQALCPPMAARGWGRVVNVTSSSGKRPSSNYAAYSVSKAAQASLSRTFADAYAGTGVLVNSVAPGPIASELWEDEGGLADQVAAASGSTRDEVLAAGAAKVPIGRYGTPGEIAAVVAFLCSEQASNVTGAHWSADGGTFASII